MCLGRLCKSPIDKDGTLDGSEIPNNHLICMNPVNNGIFTISTGDLA